MRRLAVILLALAVAPGAAAATFTFTVSTASPVTAPGVTLNGVDQTKTFTIVTRVAYTGAGNTAGWKVQASSTVPTSGSNTLPYFTVTAGSFACAFSCTTNPTTSGIGFPITLSGTAQTIYNAAANTGRGTFDITSTYQVSYAANKFPGTYAATVTLVGSTGP
jgi:hypothetical protein